MKTKERILKEALMLFAKEGYEAVSVRDIAAKLNITQAALYKHYKSKHDILESILEKMAEQDAAASRETGVPDMPYADAPSAYSKTDLASVKRFALRQFEWWTQDDFAAGFRRLVTIEQYASEDMSALFQQYFAGGVISYLEDIFCRSGVKDPYCAAVQFYSPMFMLYNLYDASADKGRVNEALKKHIRNFSPEGNYNEIY